MTGNPERAGRARTKYPDAHLEASVEGVWARGEEHDFVVVATSNESHVPLARAAIERGLSVVVDKPLAPLAADAEGLIERARSAEVLLTPFHQRRWDSDFLTLRRLVDEGEIGEVHRFESRIERWRPEVPEGSWRYESGRERGGGVLLDLGTHLVDQALQLFGPAAGVWGDVRSRRGTVADDDAFVAIRHISGTLSLLSASQVAASAGPRMRVLGSRGAFVVEGVDGQEEALAAGRLPGEGAWGLEPEERWGRLIRGDESTPVEPENGDWPEFYAQLAAGRIPVTPEDALEVLQTLERAATTPS